MLFSFVKGLSSNAVALRTKKRRGFTPTLDGLELRLTLSTASPAGIVSAYATTSINQKVVDFLAARVGQRIGGGECAHIATEALRVAGAKFTGLPADSPASGDYVWGTLVKSVSYKSGKVVESSTASVKPGDVIQYRNATFSTGSRASHHTSVVAAVDSRGRPTKVYEQNISASGVKGANRTLTLRSFDYTKLNGGYLRIYRPIASTSQAGKYAFTIVNNSPTRQTIKLFGRNYTLTEANTMNSFTTFTASGGTPSLTLNGKTFTLGNNVGYEIYGSGSSARLRVKT